MDKRWIVALGVCAMGSLAGCGLAPARPSVTPSIPGAPKILTSGGRTSDGDSGLTKYERAALRVRNFGCLSGSIGSGFAISDHTVITGRHVVCGADLLEVTTVDGQDVEVARVGAAVIADLAVVHTVQTLPATVRLAKADPPIGTAVMVVGFPLGGPVTTSRGHVLGYRKDPAGWSSLPMLLTDAPIEQGSSGSALLNEAGELVGVVYALTGPGSGYAVPVEIVNNLLKDQSGYSQPAPCGGAPATSSPSPSITPCSPAVSVGQH